MKPRQAWHRLTDSRKAPRGAQCFLSLGGSGSFPKLSLSRMVPSGRWITSSVSAAFATCHARLPLSLSTPGGHTPSLGILVATGRKLSSVARPLPRCSPPPLWPLPSAFGPMEVLSCLRGDPPRKMRAGDQVGARLAQDGVLDDPAEQVQNAAPLTGPGVGSGRPKEAAWSQNASRRCR